MVQELNKEKKQQIFIILELTIILVLLLILVFSTINQPSVDIDIQNSDSILANSFNPTHDNINTPNQETNTPNITEYILTTSTPNITPEKTYTVWINVDILKIHASEDVSSNTIGRINYATPVEGTKHGLWMYIIYEGVQGYIYTGYSNSGKKCVVNSYSDLTPITEVKKEEEDTTTYVYITKTGSKYHRYGCRYLWNSCIKTSLSSAKARGYEPCSVCNPPN